MERRIWGILNTYIVIEFVTVREVTQGHVCCGRAETAARTLGFAEVESTQRRCETLESKSRGLGSGVCDQEGVGCSIRCCGVLSKEGTLHYVER